jgi:hypothetical protein
MLSLTERAEAAIGRDDDAADWQLRPEEHGRALPSEAANLRRVLECPDLQQIVAEFRKADAAAVAAQRRYKSIGRTSLYAATTATLVGSLFLLPLDPWLAGWTRGVASIVQIGGLLTAFFAARLLAYAKPFNAWMNKRAESEIARIELFNRIAHTDEASQGDELPLLPLKLEYFRRYQLDVQRRYYRGRGEQHAAALWRNNWWLTASLVITIVSVLLALLLASQMAASWGIPVPEGLIAWSSHFPAGLTNRIMLALGVMASALYGLGIARSLMDLDERNASRYLTTAKNLEYLTETSLSEARGAAVADQPAAVFAFIDRVQALISSEHQEWILLSARDRAADAKNLLRTRVR